MRIAHRPGSLCGGTAAYRAQFPSLTRMRDTSPYPQDTSAPLIFCVHSLSVRARPETRLHTNNRSVRLPLCSCADEGTIGWRGKVLDKFLAFIPGGPTPTGAHVEDAGYWALARFRRQRGLVPIYQQTKGPHALHRQGWLRDIAKSGKPPLPTQGTRNVMSAFGVKADVG